MANKKRIWTKEELTIAYYIAKWDYYGLKVSEYDFANFIIGNTTVNSLRMQVANFRYLLNVDGYQLQDASQAMKDLVEEFSNKSISQVRKLITAYVEKCEDAVIALQHTKAKKEAKKRKNALNTQLQMVFEQKIKGLNKFRNLRPIGTPRVIGC